MSISEARIEEHFGLVKHVVNRSFAMYLVRHPDEYDDLFQVGCIGLLEGIRTHDPSRGVSVSSFAILTIWSSIYRHITRNTLIKMPSSQKFESLTVLSIDETIPESEKGECFESMLPSLDDDTAVYVTEFIRTLKPKHQEIIRYRLMGLEQTIIASIVGLSQAQVSRILREIGNSYLESGVSA